MMIHTAMQTVIVISFLIMIFMAGCSPKNIRLPEEYKRQDITAAVYIPPLPEPEATIVYSSSPIPSMTYRGVFPSYDDEARMKELMARSGFRSLIIGELQKAQHTLKHVTIKNIDNAYEGLTLVQEPGKKGRAPYYSQVMIKTGTRYLFVLAVDRWEYAYYSYGDHCFYRTEFTGELLDMSTGTVIWRYVAGRGDNTAFAPRACSFKIPVIREVLSRASASIITKMFDDIDH